jgi:hypothetical protein
MVKTIVLHGKRIISVMNVNGMLVIGQGWC